MSKAVFSLTYLIKVGLGFLCYKQVMGCCRTDTSPVQRWLTQAINVAVVLESFASTSTSVTH